MKRYLIMALLAVLPTILLAGCGGGGGGSGSATPSATKAVAKAYLFGTMSSNSTIATVQTSIMVPAGVLVNYTSPAGATTGTWPLRKGVVVPSGPVQVSAAAVANSTYDIASRKLTINVFNAPGSGQAALKTGASGSGAEIATINLTFATPGVTAALPTQDPLVVVGQDRSSSIDYLTGCTANFVTTFQ